MIEVQSYCVVNGSKSEPVEFKRQLKNRDELESLRAELDFKLNNFRIMTLTGERLRLGNIYFTYLVKT